MAIEQIQMFDIERKAAWDEHWQDMPEYKQQDLTPFKSVLVNFRNYEDYKAFAELINQKLTLKTKTIFYPKLDYESAIDRVYINTLNNSNES